MLILSPDQAAEEFRAVAGQHRNSPIWMWDSSDVRQDGVYMGAISGDKVWPYHHRFGIQAQNNSGTEAMIIVDYIPTNPVAYPVIVATENIIRDLLKNPGFDPVTELAEPKTVIDLMEIAPRFGLNPADYAPSSYFFIRQGQVYHM